MAIACSPATPAPRTTTSAGGTVPAAVMLSGKKRRSRPAATIADRYPATSACELSASIDCAREMRGMSSMENDVMPSSARSLTAGKACIVERNEIVAAPVRKACTC